MNGPDGLALIAKPAGVTSHDVVDVVRRALGTRRVGHAGTLDPMATGLLLVGVGRATRLLRFLSDLPKTYEGTIRLGIETDTLDADGREVRRTPVSCSTDEIRARAADLVGERMQRPPAFSAVSVGGRRAHEAARAGEHLEMRERPITVSAFEVLGIDGDDVRFRTVVSSGTYVRVLAEDLGRSLGCGAHLARLVRTRIGPFDLADARAPDDPALLPASAAVRHLPQVRVSAEESIAASHGRILGPADVDGPYAVTGPDGTLIGVWRDDGAKARPEVVLASPPAAGSDGDAV